MTIKEALLKARLKYHGCSDVHIIGNEQAKLRVSGKIVCLEDIIPKEDVDSFLRAHIDEKKYAQLQNLGACDLMVNVDGENIRLHAHKEQRGVRLALRLKRSEIPSLDQLGLPKIVGNWADRASGLIIVCGPSGSGKTTLLASLIDRINRANRGAIITIERPVEYVHDQHGLFVSQIQVGRDVATFELGIRAALQSDPDVLMIGEVNDPESAKAMMTATETGHLVMASMHATDTVQALERIATWGGQGAQIQLTAALIGIVCLRLMPSIDGEIVPASEILIMNDAVRNLVREDKLHQIRSIIEASQDMHTLESDLKRLISDKLIDQKVAIRHAVRPEKM